jgi:intracellular multiplication protein IcmB
MIDFATSIYIMDAGPSQAIEKTCKIFGLSETAKIALRNRVHGPREGGATFLAQYSTKGGVSVQLLTLTLGPIELWAFSTTAEDASVRNQLYRHLGPSEARRFLASLFPKGSVTKEIAERLNLLKEDGALIEDEAHVGIIDQFVGEILDAYSRDPNCKSLPSNR